MKQRRTEKDRESRHVRSDSQNCLLRKLVWTREAQEVDIRCRGCENYLVPNWSMLGFYWLKSGMPVHGDGDDPIKVSRGYRRPSS